MQPSYPINHRAFGVRFLSDRTATVSYWHPQARSVTLAVTGSGQSLPLSRQADGYWQLQTEALHPGDTYAFCIDGGLTLTDPAALLLCNGQAQAVDTAAYYWEDQSWINPPFADYHLTELAIGTLTEAGTFDAATHEIHALREAGVTAVQLGVLAERADLPYAVPAALGGPRQCQHFVNSCHFNGMAVLVDLPFADLSTLTSRTGAGLGTLLDACVDVALMWFRDFHVDGLRVTGLQAWPGGPAMLAALRQAANALSAQTGRQYYLLVDCLPTDEAARSPHVANYPCPPDQVLAGHDTTGAETSSVYQRQYLYDQQFAGALTDLFGHQI